MSFNIGPRTNKTLEIVVKTLVNSKTTKITTDKLISYKTLIETTVHSTKFKGINHIERKNLTLRTHLKRLNRKTISFSRSKTMLESCLKIYFWG